MLTDTQKDDSLRLEIQSLAQSIGAIVVEAKRGDTLRGTTIQVTLYTKDHEITTGELAKVYNLVYPRYQVILGDRDLSLEVSSPGLQRNIKDYYEFSVFVGKCVRVYCDKYSSWVIGDIVSADDTSVTLSSVLIEDSKETFETLHISYIDIQKAKLEFRQGGKEEK